MAKRPNSLASRLISIASHTQSPSHPSTTHRGTAFENRSLKILHNHLSMSLLRVGGKSDGGIDLLGWWWLPALDSTSLSDDHSKHKRWRIRVLAQCKAQRKKPSPTYVREMEGVVHEYLSSPSQQNSLMRQEPNSPHDNLSPAFTPHYPLVALLISESPFTKATLLRAHSSSIPFFLLHVPPPTLNSHTDDEQEQIGTAVWNPALSGTHGLLRGLIEVRWERSLNGLARPGLWYRGQKLDSWIPDGESCALDGPTGSVQKPSQVHHRDS